MKNAFIIVNFNDYKSTKHLVDNIKDYKCLDYILIIDNNSRPKEKEMLSSIKNKKIEIVYNEENYGYSKAINIASKYLIDKYGDLNLIISNSDVVIMSEKDIKTMLDYLKMDKVGIVGPQIIEKGHISRGVKNITPALDALNNIPFFRNLIKDKRIYYNDNYYNEDKSIVDVVNSCFFLITSEVLQKINYMDEQVFLYYEDYILSKKVQNLGLVNIVCNNVKIKHNFSVSVDKNIDVYQKEKTLHQSQYYYHTTYNKAKFFSRILLKISSSIGIMSKSVSNNKNKQIKK